MNKGNQENTRRRGRPPKIKAAIPLNMVDAQADFVRYFIEQDFKDPPRAYMRAFPEAKEITAKNRAYLLLKKPEVQAALSTELEAVLKERRRPLEKQILDVWTVRAFYDPTEIINLDGTLRITEEELRARGLHVCIDSINLKMTAKGDEYVEYKLADRDQALEMLQRYIQMIKPFDAKVGDGEFAFSVSFVKSQDADNTNTNK